MKSNNFWNINAMWFPCETRLITAPEDLSCQECGRGIYKGEQCCGIIAPMEEYLLLCRSCMQKYVEEEKILNNHK